MEEIIKRGLDSYKWSTEFHNGCDYCDIKGENICPEGCDGRGYYKFMDDYDVMSYEIQKNLYIRNPNFGHALEKKLTLLMCEAYENFSKLRPELKDKFIKENEFLNMIWKLGFDEGLNIK